jgi:hypothetical protein
MEALNDGPDDIVQARAKPAAGDDAGLKTGRIKEDPFPGTGHFQAGRRHPVIQIALKIGQSVVIQNLLCFGNKPGPRHGGREAAVAEAVNGKIQIQIHFDSLLGSLTLKLEIRSTKSETNPNDQNLKSSKQLSPIASGKVAIRMDEARGATFRILVFGHSNLFRVSDFGFRI